MQSALKLLAAAEAFVVVSSSENGPVDSSPCASEADVGFPITAAQVGPDAGSRGEGAGRPGSVRK